MTCKFCGNVIEDNSDICFICGQKVEAAPVAEAAADAFAPAAPVAPVYAGEVPAAPVAPAAPVYAAAPVAPAAPAVADIKAQKKALKEAKKAAKKAKSGNKGTGSISKGRLLLAAAIVILIFAIKSIAVYAIAAGIIFAFFTYRSYNKAIAAGDTATASRIINSAMIGACVGMAVACVLLVNQSFFPAADAAVQ